MLQNVLNWVVGVCGTVAIIALAIFLTKDVISYVKGQGTGFLKILGKVGAVILIVAIMFMTKTFNDKAEKLSTGVDNVVNQGIDEVNNGLGGS